MFLYSDCAAICQKIIISEPNNDPQTVLLMLDVHKDLTQHE